MSEKNQVQCEHCGKWVYWLDAYYFRTSAYCDRKAQLEAIHNYFDKMKQGTNDTRIQPTTTKL